jgi:prolyl oligopeptidase
MFITSNSSIPITKSTPVLLYIYGAYSISVIPHFRPDFLAFLRSFNGVLAIANVRGGGEYGSSWNAAARKEKRQILFNDVISGIRYLKEELGSEEVVLMGESMGALNAAAVMVQVPELLKGVFLNVGVLDVLRKERLGMRDRGSDDVGSSGVPGDFDSMVKWAPMENLRVGVGRRYPSVQLMAGERDEVVSAAHSVKMAAALQFAIGGEGGDGEGEGNGVVGLRIMKDAGHGVGNSGEVKKTA